MKVCVLAVSELKRTLAVHKQKNSSTNWEHIREFENNFMVVATLLRTPSNNYVCTKL